MTTNFPTMNTITQGSGYQWAGRVPRSSALSVWPYQVYPLWS